MKKHVTSASEEKTKQRNTFDKGVFREYQKRERFNGENGQDAGPKTKKSGHLIEERKKSCKRAGQDKINL